MPNILIVEDDVPIAQMIREALSLGGYQSEICSDGTGAVSTALSGEYDLILLDVMLPVIFLTARQDVADKVKGLRLGAEDYIVKPFEVVELLARIEVVLRRFHRLDSVLTYRDITLNLTQHTAHIGEQPVLLTPKEFDLLAFFIQNQTIALTRERLLCAVWGYGFEGQTRTVDTHVQQLRKKCGLQDDLITIPRLGYRLRAEGSL